MKLGGKEKRRQTKEPLAVYLRTKLVTVVLFLELHRSLKQTSLTDNL